MDLFILKTCDKLTFSVTDMTVFKQISFIRIWQMLLDQSVLKGFITIVTIMVSTFKYAVQSSPVSPGCDFQLHLFPGLPHIQQEHKLLLHKSCPFPPVQILCKLSSLPQICHFMHSCTIAFKTRVPLQHHWSDLTSSDAESCLCLPVFL